MEAHRRLFDVGALLGQEHRLGLGDRLGEVQCGGRDHGFATGRQSIQGMPWQAAVPATDLGRVEVGPQGVAGVLQLLRLGRIEHVQRWSWRALADGVFHAADPEREARVLQAAVGVAVGFAAIDQGQGTDSAWRGVVMAGVVIALLLLVVIVFRDQGLRQLRNHRDLARHRRHGLAWQRYDGRDGCTGDDLTVRQGPGARGRLAAAQGERHAVKTALALARHFQAGAFLEHIVDPPHAPHALGKVRVEVAMVDSVAGHAVAVARAAVGDFVGVADTRADALGIDIVGVVVIGVEQPLVTVQVEDMLLVAVMGVAELDHVADVAVVDVGRFRRVKGHGGLDPDLLGARGLARANVLKADVGRYVHQHRHVADGVRTQEELFVGAGQAVMHRAHAQTVGHHLGAHAAGAVVDHERIAGRLQNMPHHRVGPVSGKGLGRGGFIGELRGEIAKRLQAVGDGRVTFAEAFQRVGRGREAAIGVGPHDDGVGLTGDDLVAVGHGNDRRAGLALADPGFLLRVARLVVDDRLASGGAAAAAQAHFFFGEGIAEGAPTFGQHHDLAEQAVGDVAGSAFTAEGRALAGGGKRAFAFGIQGVGAAGAGGDQEVAIAPGVGGDVGDAVDRLHAVDLKADMAVGNLFVGDKMLAAWLVACGGFVLFSFVFLAFDLVLFFVVDTVLVRVGLVGQQVLQVDGQAVARRHPQHDRPRALVRAQADFTRHCRSATGQRHLVLVDHIAAQGEHHAVGILRTQAVEHQWLIDRHHIGHQVALAAHGGFAERLPAQAGGGDQQ
ncbi:hypothetical protein D3C78_314460 [compost metagenome]